MSENFEIFEDQENFNKCKALSHAEIKRDHIKLAPLTNKAIQNENIGERNILKALKPSETFGGTSRAFKDKNVFPQVKDAKEVLKQKDEVFVADDSIVNITSESFGSSYFETSAASFTYRKDTHDDEIATPMSVADVGTPMSVDKSAIAVEHKLIKNDRDRFYEVPEYHADILNYLKLLENQKNVRPRPDYMKKQPDINDSMRTILIDWLVEVSEEYRLQSETLCLAVHYIDRFLSHMSVVRAKLQLVGTTAMLVASKYEEIYPPEIGEFVYITDDTYTKQQVLRMEKLLLRVLTFDLNSPTSLYFNNLFAIMMNIPDKIRFMAQYLCELSMLRASPFLNYSPSLLSASALALSFYTHGNSIWSKKMQETFGYDLEELRDTILQLNELHFEAETLAQQAIQEKFKSNKYMQASVVKPKKISSKELDDIIAKFNVGDELNTTAENIECVRQKTEMLFN